MAKERNVGVLMAVNNQLKVIASVAAEGINRLFNEKPSSYHKININTSWKGRKERRRGKPYQRK